MSDKPLSANELESAVRVYEYLRRKGVQVDATLVDKVHALCSAALGGADHDEMSDGENGAVQKSDRPTSKNVPVVCTSDELDQVRTAVAYYKFECEGISIAKTLSARRTGISRARSSRGTKRRTRVSSALPPLSKRRTAEHASRDCSIRARHNPDDRVGPHSRAQFLTLIFRGVSTARSRAVARRRDLRSLCQQAQKRVQRLERQRRDARTREAAKRLEALKNQDYAAYEALVKAQKNDRLQVLLNKTKDVLKMVSEKLSASAAQSISNDAAENSSRASTSTVEQQPRMLTGGSLKAHQMVGLQWLVSLHHSGLNGILADEMGLGKTVQAIALLCHLYETGDYGPHLVVGPLSTLQHWADEFHRWAPTLQILVFHGGKTDRRVQWNRELASGARSHVIITSYEMARIEETRLSGRAWSALIVDEGHRLKNAKSRLFGSLSRFKTRRRLLLTGTPLQNDIGELWSLLHFLMPSVFDSPGNFDAWFAQPLEVAGVAIDDEARALTLEERCLVIDRLHRVLRPFLLRRLKSAVLELPPKIERQVRVALSAWQSIVYGQIQRRSVTGHDAKGRITRRSLQNTVMQLRKVVNHPLLIDNGRHLGEDDEYPPGGLIRASGKVEFLSRALPKLFLTGHRVVIFFQMTRMMDIFEDFLDSALPDVEYRRLDGSTPHPERRAALADFAAIGSDVQLMILSTRAGGLGLNLQAADTLILYDSDWNPMADLQAQCRVHRIGQKRAVLMLRLVSDSPVERHILARAKRKLDLSDMVIRGGCFDQESTPTAREALLRQMVKESLVTTDAQTGGSGPTLNELLARDQRDRDTFARLDRERATSSTASSPNVPQLMQADEVPGYVLIPEALLHEQACDVEAYFGRGKRRRKPVVYAENMSEEEATKLLDQGIDPMAAAWERARSGQ